MTIGIYKLCFEGTDEVYIGQSIDIEERYKTHLQRHKKGKGISLKLQNAFKTYGIPNITILKECEVSVLDYWELLYIKEYNAVEAGFNTFDGTTNRCTYVDSSINRKYPKEKYIEIFKLIIEGTLTCTQIAEITNTSHSVAKHIKSGRSCKWLKELFPSEYLILENRLNNYKPGAHRTKTYPPVLSPKKEEIIITNMAQFCRDNNLNPSCMRNVINNMQSNHKGWTLKSNKEDNA